MSPTLTAIRRGTAADADALTAIFLAARARMTYLPTLHTDAETRWWMEHVVLARSQVLVAIAEGVPVGFAALGQTTLDHLYVAPAAQSQGVGSALLASAQASARTLTLQVFERNVAAQRFYRRHGFTATGGGTANEEGMPDIRMTWHQSGQ